MRIYETLKNKMITYISILQKIMYDVPLSNNVTGARAAWSVYRLCCEPDGLGFGSPYWQEIFLISRRSRRALEPNQASIQWVPGVPSGG